MSTEKKYADIFAAIGRCRPIAPEDDIHTRLCRACRDRGTDGKGDKCGACCGAGDVPVGMAWPEYLSWRQKW